MKFQRFIGGALAVGMVCSSAVFAFAGTQDMVVREAMAMSQAMAEGSEKAGEMPKAKLTEAQVEEIVRGHIKKFFDIELEGENLQSRIEYRPDWNQRDKYVWQMNFFRHSRDGGLDIHVIISDENQKILSLNKYEYRSGINNIVSKYTREESQKIADEFLKRMNGDIVNQLVTDPRYENMYYHPQYSNGLQPTEYRFFYAREVDGILVADNGISIGVNSGSGEVTSYSYRWTDEELPQKKNIISKEEAEEILKKNLDFKLSYVPVRDEKMGYDQTPKEIKLAYAPHFEVGPMIDAYTGNMLDYQGQARDEIRKVDITEEQKESFKQLTSNRKVREKEMTREEATGVARSILEQLYEGEIKIDSANYTGVQPYSGYGNRKVWSIQFRIGDSWDASGNITIDAQTEEVLNLHNYNWRMREMYMMSDKEIQRSIDWEGAFNKSIEVLKVLYPEKIKDLRTEQVYRGGSVHHYNNRIIRDVEYYFSFLREENGIPYTNNTIHVSFDAMTGALQNIHYRWDDVTFPKAEGLMDQAQALKSYMNQSELKLQYMNLYIPKEGGEAESQIKLVYMNQPKEGMIYNYIDAKTGVFLDWNGQEAKERKARTDAMTEAIKGHWAERELSLMMEQGIIDLDAFELGDKLPKKEILKMMVMSMGYWPHMGMETGELKFTDLSQEDPYYSYIQAAVFHNLIKNETKPLNGDDFVTREQLASMLVNMVKLDKVASIKGIYTIPVKDIDQINPDLLGHVALAYGVGIIKGGGDVYSPQTEVTLDQVAIGIYRVFEQFGIRY